ncbi:MAG: epoxyqueuosine reductase, partial [Bacillota bacterium]
ALGRIGGGEALDALRRALEAESDAGVREEIRAALAAAEGVLPGGGQGRP